MTRPTLRNMQDNIDAIWLGKPGLVVDQWLKRRIVRREYKATGDTALALVLNKQEKLERHNAVFDSVMPRRRKSKKRQRRAGRRKDYKTPEGFNECGLQTGRSYASKAGERMEQKQAGFPDVMRHPSTINIAIVPLVANLKVMVDAHRPRLRNACAQLSFGFQAEGMFQIVLKSAAYIASIIPSNEWPTGFDPVARPDQVFAMLHVHLIIADPHKTKKEVRNVLSAAYSGCRRVCVAKVQPERLTKDGEVTAGAQGYFEYSALDKVEVKFDKTEQKKEAILGHARLSATWSNRNRSFSMGKALGVTGVAIDKARVVELETLERLDFIKSQGDKLGAAEQFMLLWRSGVIKLIRMPRYWTKLGGDVSSRFIQVISLVKNWSVDEDAKDLDFYDYAAPLLE